MVFLLNTSLVQYLHKICMHKTYSRERNNEYMKRLHLYADEETCVLVLDLTFTENQQT